MSGSDVQFGFPLTRLNPWYPGQMGVPGTWNETGLRTHCTGTVFYVSPNHPAASDLRDGTDPNDPLLTIGTAVQRCESFRGDVIAVMPHGLWQWAPGTIYPAPIWEDVVLNKHGVRLVGVSSSSIGIPWYGAGIGSINLHVTGIDCVVEGFAFCPYEADTTGVGVFLDYQYGDNGTVRHCTFHSPLGTGIMFDDSWYCDIRDNAFWMTAYGLFSDSGGGAPTQAAPDYAHVYRNLFHDCSTAAIWTPGINYAYIQENKVYNSAAQGAAAATNEGFVTNDGTVAGGANTVDRNVFSCQNTAVAAGDYGDLNGGSPTDNWTHSYCMNGLAYGIP